MTPARPLQPVSPRVQLESYAAGVGIIAINGTRYAVRVTRDDHGRFVAARLVKAESLKEIDVHRDPAGRIVCDCQDAVYRPDRSGGCKHVAALDFAGLSADECPVNPECDCGDSEGDDGLPACFAGVGLSEAACGF